MKEGSDKMADDLDEMGLDYLVGVPGQPGDRRGVDLLADKDELEDADDSSIDQVHQGTDTQAPPWAAAHVMATKGARLNQQGLPMG
jgi:hypothetical protein